MTTTSHLNQTLSRELDRLMGEIELDYFRQRGANTETYLIPYGHLARLLAVGMPTVSENVGEFFQAAIQFTESLPDSPAKSVLASTLNFDVNDGISMLTTIFRETRWQSFGCPAVNLESRLAASLMLTEAPAEVLEELHAPWGCFVIRLPRDLIEHEEVDYTHIVVHRFHQPSMPREVVEAINAEDGVDPSVAKRAFQFIQDREGTHWGVYGLSGNQGHLQGEGKLLELLGRVDREYLVAPELPIGDPGERVMGLFARLAVGVCLLTQSEGALRRKSPKKGERGSSRMGAGPVTTEYVLGHKINVGYNCLDAVKTYVRGESQSLPAIQWLVRGHWRQQPVGPGRSSRKRIWIMPHWKGPQEAPRLFREYEFSSSLSAPGVDTEDAS